MSKRAQEDSVPQAVGTGRCGWNSVKVAAAIVVVAEKMINLNSACLVFDIRAWWKS